MRVFHWQTEGKVESRCALDRSSTQFVVIRELQMSTIVVSFYRL